MSSHPSGARPRVVVVDDDPAILMLVSTMLKVGLQAEVHTFPSAEEAVVGWPVLGPVGLVVTDYFMPGLSGVELAAHLRARTPELPIIVLSAVEGSVDAPAGVVTAWLTKPCPPRVLLPLARRLLGLPEGAVAEPWSAPAAAPASQSLPGRPRAPLHDILTRLGELAATEATELGDRALKDELHQLASAAGSHGLKDVTEAVLSLRGAIAGRAPRDEAVRRLRLALEDARARGRTTGEVASLEEADSR